MKKLLEASMEIIRKELTEDKMSENTDIYRHWSGIATFLRAAHRPDMEETDIGLIGFPYSGGNSIERMQHHGPRAVRNRSCAYRRAHRFLQIDPFETLRISDLGDVPLPNMRRSQQNDADPPRHRRQKFTSQRPDRHDPFRRPC